MIKKFNFKKEFKGLKLFIVKFILFLLFVAAMITPVSIFLIKGLFLNTLFGQLFFLYQ